MPPRTTIEEFDDDTDLPLPTFPYLPNTGTSGAILQDARDFGYDTPSFTPPIQRQPQSAPQRAAQPDSSAKTNIVTDVTPYKK